LLSISPDQLEGDHPRRSALKRVLYAIYSRQAQAASVTAADLQLAERHGDGCDDVEAFAEPPVSDDKSILPNGKMEPVLSSTTDTLDSIECELAILLADEESSSE
jgi:hypothetical protein